jgi:pimeloyl-ACP methyl ester carboxylesterase
VLHYEDITDATVVGHSYGGMVITGVGDRAAERVGRLVYLDAANPKNGESLMEISPGPMEAARAAGRVVDGVELVLFPGTDPLNFYGVTDPDDIEWMKPKLTPHPWRCFEQKLELRNEGALWAIPQYHIVCTSTLATRNPELIGKARADGRMWEIDTGHDLMITEPRAVAGALLEIATST